MSRSRSPTVLALVLSVVALVAFAVLHALHLAPGNLVDWLVGVGSAWWLLALTTIPWNVYFAALEVLDEARVSAEKGIEVDAAGEHYARRLAARALLAAVALHVVTAAALWLLAWRKVTPVGYAASAAALLLTGARPLHRLYAYLVQRLGQIRQVLRYPRDDVREVRRALQDLADRLGKVEAMLDLREEHAWAAGQQRGLERLGERMARAEAALEENSADHARLARQSADEIARLSEDGRFLGQVRELIRFVKSA